MRKFVALALVALLSLTMAIAMVGCGASRKRLRRGFAHDRDGVDDGFVSDDADTGMADTSSMQH
jgi:hypothetical protein